MGLSECWKKHRDPTCSSMGAWNRALCPAWLLFYGENSCSRPLRPRPYENQADCEKFKKLWFLLIVHLDLGLTNGVGARTRVGNPMVTCSGPHGFRPAVGAQVGICYHPPLQTYGLLPRSMPMISLGYRQAGALKSCVSHPAGQLFLRLRLRA